MFRNLILVAMAVGAASMAGWFSINRQGDQTTIQIDKAKIRDDTFSAINRGREYLDEREQRLADQGNAAPGSWGDDDRGQSYGDPVSGNQNYNHQGYPAQTYPGQSYPTQNYSGQNYADPQYNNRPYSGQADPYPGDRYRPPAYPQGSTYPQSQTYPQSNHYPQSNSYPQSSSYPQSNSYPQGNSYPSNQPSADYQSPYHEAGYRQESQIYRGQPQR